jgi:ribosomal protein S12 methylthiotransferase accessory factor
VQTIVDVADRDTVTWTFLMPIAREFGVERVADLTGLDIIGIPTAAAVVPDSHSLSVFQGKGAMLCSAKIGAVLEAAEAWHAERHTPPACCLAPMSTVESGYDPRLLPDRNREAPADSASLEWISAEPAVPMRRAGGATLVPRALVDMSPGAVHDPFRPYLATSNGLGAGSDRDRAVLHGLLEVIERDATATLAELGVDDRVYLDLSSVTEPLCAEILARLRALGVWVEVVLLPGRAGITIFVAYLWSPDMPAISGGAAADCQPASALFRALSEAAQSRLTAISGARDDVPPRLYGIRANGSPTRAKRPALQTLAEAADLPGSDAHARLEVICQRLAGDGLIPLVVTLDPGDVHVVKVIVPGLRHGRKGDLSRPVSG